MSEARGVGDSLGLLEYIRRLLGRCAAICGWSGSQQQQS
jgi:hypothetical protein